MLLVKISVAQGTNSKLYRIPGVISSCVKPSFSTLSHLLITRIKPLPASLIRPAIFWSSCTFNSLASITSRQMSDCSIALRLRITLKRSMPTSILPLRLIPAVSSSSISRPLNFTIVLLMSRVVPARSATIACCFLARVLNSCDLPTFGRPKIAIRTRSGASSIVAFGIS